MRKVLIIQIFLVLSLILGKAYGIDSRYRVFVQMSISLTARLAHQSTRSSFYVTCGQRYLPYHLSIREYLGSSRSVFMGSFNQDVNPKFQIKTIKKIKRFHPSKVYFLGSTSSRKCQKSIREVAKFYHIQVENFSGMNSNLYHETLSRFGNKKFLHVEHNQLIRPIESKRYTSFAKEELKRLDSYNFYRSEINNIQKIEQGNKQRKRSNKKIDNRITWYFENLYRIRNNQANKPSIRAEKQKKKISQEKRFKKRSKKSKVSIGFLEEIGSFFKKILVSISSEPQDQNKSVNEVDYSKRLQFKFNDRNLGEALYLLPENEGASGLNCFAILKSMARKNIKKNTKNHAY